MTTTLWVEPALGAVSGGLRYNQQLRQALQTMGCDAHTLSLPPESFDSAEGAAAIHQQRQSLTGDAGIVGWIEKQPGIDAKKFNELFKSFTVVGKAKRAMQLTTDYKVEGVPALGVAGRFYVDGGTAGSLERALQVTDALIVEARKG